MAMVGTEAVKYMSHCFPDISAQRADCGNIQRKWSRRAVFQKTRFPLETVFHPLLSSSYW